MLILGVDEAGRGPVVGSMILAGVMIEETDESKLKRMGAKDSKLVPPKKREELYTKIKKLANETHFIEVTASEIDERRKRMSLNELEAMKVAEVIEMFRRKPGLILIDLPDPDGGKFIRRIEKYTELPCKTIAEHKADMRYPVVSAASIIAKVERDRSIRRIEKEHKICLRTGYSHDNDTIKFLEEHIKKGEFPDFVRKSWITAQRIQDKKFQKKLLDYD
jgi:ribonuclease HII